MKPAGGGTDLKPNHSFLASSLCPAQQLCLILYFIIIYYLFI